MHKWIEIYFLRRNSILTWFEVDRKSYIGYVISLYKK